ncbi:hypothetical protein B0T19DRAFT_438292 [Cercophora scortea]|uniref:Uncharacterized protein n=1 Tax=Cercophora scortea TaxID=314031 RepID=A0AAE0J6X7_9PEZI|nr:hypothetical protein B0T19DRAFT_438292 [Cercophora scortea]
MLQTAGMNSPGVHPNVECHDQENLAPAVFLEPLLVENNTASDEPDNCHQQRPASAPSAQPKRRTRRAKDSAKLLAAAPRTEHDWQKRREHLQLSDDRSVMHIFLYFLHCAGPLAVSAATGRRDDVEGVHATDDLLRTYQGFYRHLLRAGERIQQLTNFVTLLFIALCRVARGSGRVPVEKVNEFMNEMMVWKKGTDYLGRLRRSVCWPAQQAEALRPWLGNRADEFFLLYGPPIETYRSLLDEATKNIHDGGAPSFADRMKDTSEIGEGYGARDHNDDCETSLTEVNTALMTNLRQDEFEASVFNAWSRMQSMIGITRCLVTGDEDREPDHRDRHQQTLDGDNTSYRHKRREYLDVALRNLANPSSANWLASSSRQRVASLGERVSRLEQEIAQTTTSSTPGSTTDFYPESDQQDLSSTSPPETNYYHTPAIESLLKPVSTILPRPRFTPIAPPGRPPRRRRLSTRSDPSGDRRRPAKRRRVTDQHPGTSPYNTPQTSRDPSVSLSPEPIAIAPPRLLLLLHARATYR